MRELMTHALYLLALINPVSKISVLAVLPSGKPSQDFRQVAAKSSAVAAILLLAAMTAGDFLLRSVFHAQVHSLRVAGGIVLFWVGFNALRRGLFFEEEIKARFEDVAIVPLACPMIAGPGTIAASITLSAQQGVLAAAAAMVIAVAANHVIMLCARPLAALLRRFNVLGAMIRITGLIVMTIGTQMVLDGLGEWFAAAARP
ncbi:MAG: MarC family protein [bacterium]